MNKPFLMAGLLLAASAATAHDWHPGEDPGRAAGLGRAASPAEAALLAEAAERSSPAASVLPPARAGSGDTAAPQGLAMEASFRVFAPAVRVRRDERYLHVESEGLPAHNMMVGITAWQQQVPLPQAYTGANAWRLPLQPVPSANPVSIRDRFLRGAIALAANGIPIFNPQNNRGEISQQIGELDEWGGHCGRADDYHYHAAPLHLQEQLGPDRPIAIALDGYPIYGLTEPGGGNPTGLDAFRGHETPGLGYHYHASREYPYVNGGFHGQVVEQGGQVDPQPRASSVRQAQPPLRGARITQFKAAPDHRSFSLDYQVNGRPAAIRYSTQGDGHWLFRFTGPDGIVREETYRAGERRGGPGRAGGPPPQGGRRPRPRPE
ncbi:MAG: hypothetical protein RJA22_1270 [Verrucomicrobiota bacterium]|jgi:hypothetical protein